MIKFLKKYLIPNEGNDYKPYALRGRATSVVVLVAILLLIFSLAQNIVLRNTNILATIISSTLVDLTNDSRIENNLNPLTQNPVLALAAQKKANDMAENEYFAHNSPDGTTPWHWFNEAGYLFVNAGENLAINFSDSEDVTDAWLESPAHRANILNKNFTEIGIAMSKGEYEGEDTIFVVQMFGHPAIASLPVAPVEVIDPEVLRDPIVESEEDTFVLGQEAQPLPEPKEANDQNLEVIVGDGEFIAVTNSENISDTDSLVLGEEISYASAFSEMITSPRNTLNRIYFVLALIGLIALVVNILVEIRKQHPLHICYGICVILLLIIFMFVNKEFILTEVSIL